MVWANGTAWPKSPCSTTWLAELTGLLTMTSSENSDQRTTGLVPRGPVMEVLHRYAEGVDRLAGALGFVSVVLVFPTLLVAVVNVVLRTVGGRIGQSLTSNALIEVQWYLFGMIFVLGFGYILREGINVRVDFWFTNRSSRTQSWIDLIGHLTSLIPFALIGIRYSWPSVLLSWEQGETSPDPGGLYRPPIKTALMLAFVFILIQGIAEVIRNIEFLRGHAFRNESDAPVLAGGQDYNVENFDIARDSGFRAAEVATTGDPSDQRQPIEKKET